MADMLAALSWYVVISFLGWLTFPLTYRLLPRLADRGYLFSRALGLLLWGYCFWLLASLGVLRNDPGGLLLALMLLLAASLWAGRNDAFAEMLAWARAQRRLILSGEALFALAFAGMAFVRAANPEILGTEKPMELAFINAILRSPTFPPHDPWLSGYAISYYYFGYVLVALLAKLSQVPGGVAFNLGVTLVFALSAVGAYGVVYNLLSLFTEHFKGGEAVRLGPRLWLATLGPVFALLVSNVEGFLHVLHTRGLFWRLDSSGEWVSPFWRWLDIVDLNQPPAQPFSWIPTRFWWWWRASRVVQDYNFSASPLEIIDEFPVFSYLLADLHPHVLAMPFAFLAMGLALNLFLSPEPPPLRWLRFRLEYRAQAWIAGLLFIFGVAACWLGLSTLSLRLTALGLIAMIAGGLFFIKIPPSARRKVGRLLTQGELGESELGLSLGLEPLAFWLYALVLGGLAFLNTWDFPFFLVLFAGVYTFRLLHSNAAKNHLTLGMALSRFFSPALGLGLAGVLLYLPFYLGFSSQAGGILPNLIYPTRGAHLWVMFGTLLLPVLAYLIYLWRENGSVERLRRGFAASAGLMVLLWALSFLFAGVILLLPVVNSLFLSSLGAVGGVELFLESVLRRLTSSGGWLTALALLGLTIGLLLPRGNEGAASRERLGRIAPAPIFALLLVLMGALLVMGPEFFYLRDQFGWRINTIFKFYYLAWLFWSVVAAFGSAVLLLALPRAWGVVFRLGLSLILVIGFTYTLLGLWSKTNGFRPAAGFTLDGTAYLRREKPDEAAAIDWLKAAPPGVVAEAVGGSYSEFARVATLSGLPNVLGWPGHESQWRGGAREMGSRQADLARLYCTRHWEEALQVLQQYHIRYVYIGELERSSYAPGTPDCPAGLSEDKFRANLVEAFRQGSVVIYEFPAGGVLSAAR